MRVGDWWLRAAVVEAVVIPVVRVGAAVVYVGGTTGHANWADSKGYCCGDYSTRRDVGCQWDCCHFDFACVQAECHQTSEVTLGVAGDVSTLIGPRMVPQEESLLAAVVPGQPLFVVVLVAVV